MSARRLRAAIGWVARVLRVGWADWEFRGYSVALGVLLLVMVGLHVDAQRVRAQSVSQQQATVLAEIQAQAGPLGLAPCLIAIVSVEDPGGDPHQLNLEGSGAQGEFQFMPATWASTPTGQSVPLAVASVAQQVQAALELIMSGGMSAWAPIPPACSGF